MKEFKKDIEIYDKWRNEREERFPPREIDFGARLSVPRNLLPATGATRDKLGPQV